MSRMPPSFSGGLSCAMAAVAVTVSNAARIPENRRLNQTSPANEPHLCGLKNCVVRSCRMRRQNDSAFVFPLNGMASMCQHRCMFCSTIPFGLRRIIATVVILASLALPFAGTPAQAAGCSFEAQGAGRVAEVVDARTLHLEDGRDISLAGIEPVMGGAKAQRIAALAAIVAGRRVSLQGQDDTPDRYGREPVFVFLQGSDTPVQVTLLSQGAALVAADVTDRDCAVTLLAAEGEAGRTSAASGPTLRP